MPAIRILLWAAFAILFCVLLLNRLALKSMFFDGLIYASLARNMAEGDTSFWQPGFSQTMFPLFSEHPPLMFWLQAVGFRLFGDTIWVEKAYALAMAVVAGFLLLGIWRRLNNANSTMRDLGVVALIFTLVGGRVAWGIGNNTLENTLTVFTLFSVYMIVIAYSRAGRMDFLSRFPFIVAAGLAIGLALLTKGPVGLFPLATVGIHWIAFGRIRFSTAVADTLVIFLSIVGLVSAILIFPEAREYLDRYVTQQLLASLSGARGSAGGGWNAVWTFVRLLRYPVIVTLIVVATYRVLRGKGMVPAAFPVAFTLDNGRNAIFFALVGLSASVPLFVSPRIYSFYFNPSTPYFSAALAILCLPPLIELVKMLPLQSIRGLNLVLLLGAAGSLMVPFLSLGKADSGDAVLGDAVKIGDHVCGAGVRCGAMVLVCPALFQDWQLHGYLQRYYRISLATPADNIADESGYMIANGACSPSDTEGRVPVDLDLGSYSLLKR